MCRAAKNVAFVVALFALLALGACGGREHVVVLRDWTFVSAAGSSEEIHLPTRVDGRLPHAPTEFHLRTHVVLPSALQGQRLTLAFPQLHARSILLANGQEMVGLVPEMSEGYRGTDQPRWRIPADVTQSGAIDLDLSVSYRMVMSGWLDIPPRLSDTDEGDAAFLAVADFNRVAAVTCMIAVLVTSFTYAVVFALDRRRAAYGWFALQGVVGGGGYAIIVEGVSERWFGVYEHCFIPTFLCIGVLASVEFTHAQFGLPRPSRVWWWGVGLCLVASLVLTSPFVGPRVLPPWSCLMIMANVCYQVPLARRIWRTRGKPLSALVILVSWVALAVLGGPDLVTWLGFGEVAFGLRAACWGFFLVAFLQSLVLSVEHHRTLARTDVLNVELTHRVDALSAKNAEVLRLNDELRRQIGARADALALALAQASSPRTAIIQSLAPGEIVAKRYEVKRAVGEGATGKVYEVVRLTDGARLALKLLDPSSDATEMARFAREAQIISQIDHPNVIRIADVDVTHEGFFYLIVEFVEGLSLRHHYPRERSLLWNVTVLAQVAEGLATIHASGIVHRDLKPANVLVTSAPGAGEADAPVAKIADFGISSTGVDRDFGAEEETVIGAHASGAPPAGLAALGLPLPANDGSVKTGQTGSSTSSLTHSDSLLTQTGAWMGTPKYMAPELGGAARHARPASDVFAFGVMAYEMIASENAFEEPPAITRAKGEPFVKPARLRAAAAAGVVLDARVLAVLEASLAELPADRPSARELADALRAYAAQLAMRQRGGLGVVAGPARGDVSGAGAGRPSRSFRA